MTDIIMSVWPEEAEGIYSGKQLYLIKRFFNPQLPVSRCFVYETFPCCMITGEFVINDYTRIDISDLAKYITESSEPSEFLKHYLKGFKSCVAIEIDRPKKYAKPSKCAPPQSYKYCNNK